MAFVGLPGDVEADELVKRVCYPPQRLLVRVDVVLHHRTGELHLWNVDHVRHRGCWELGEGHAVVDGWGRCRRHRHVDCRCG